MDEALVQDLLVLSQRMDLSAQYAALDALSHVPNFLTEAEVASVFVRAAGAHEPVVSAKALALIGTAAPGLEDLAGLRVSLERSRGAMDPGVRGRALRTLSGVVRTEPDRVRAVEACLEGLGDAHPYVRASALAGLGHLGEVAAIERMLPLLEDPAPAVYDLTGWSHLDGRPGLLHHDGSLLSRVDDAALDALVQASLPLAGQRFRRPVRLPEEQDAEFLSRSRLEAQRWAASRQALIADFRRAPLPSAPAASAAPGATGATGETTGKTTAGETTAGAHGAAGGLDAADDGARQGDAAGAAAGDSDARGVGAATGAAPTASPQSEADTRGAPAAAPAEEPAAGH